MEQAFDMLLNSNAKEHTRQPRGLPALKQTKRDQNDSEKNMELKAMS